jgi:hypothetical protein
MNIIFQIDGGIGKSIMATAVCRVIKKHYPDAKLIVVTGYPEVFICNPFVYKSLHFNTPYFFQDYIMGQEVKFMLHNPYLETSFLTKSCHLIETWCSMFGLKYEGEAPELFMSNLEYNVHLPTVQSPRPVLVLQTNGGGASNQRYSWARDMPQPIAQEVVNALSADYHIVHLRRKDQPSLEGVTPLESSLRTILVLLSTSTKRLLIDSFVQHAAAALRMPSVVCWIANSPAQFGYSIHANIMSNSANIQPDLRFAQYNEFNIGGEPVESPYRNETDIFDAALIVKTVREFNGPAPMTADPLQQSKENSSQPAPVAVLPNVTESPEQNIKEEPSIEVHLPEKAKENNTKKLLKVS